MKRTTTLIAGILTTTTALSGAILTSTFVSADDVIDEINIIVPVSCSLSGVGMNSHNATINNGQYNSTIGETAIKAFCNDNNGFAIYAIGYTDDTDGNNVLTSSTLGSEHDIVTGTATSGNTSNWAMKLSTITDPVPTYPIIIAGSTADTDKEQGDPDYSFFQEVPDDYALVAKRVSGTDIGQSAEGATIKTTYQAYISPTQPAGTYTGQVKYTIVHPNDGSAPGGPISIEKAYAKSGKQKFNGYYKMQEMSDSICSIVTLYDEASQTQLIDIRDNKTYYVAKLQDGNCWMTQNLDHDIVTTTNYYTNQNTDIGYNSSTGSYDTASWTAEYATNTSSDTYWCDEAAPYRPSSCSGFSIASYDPGELYWNGEFGDYDENKTSSVGNSHYHLGNYYNWNAAMATNDPSYLDDDTLMDQSICPTGWTLPRAGTGEDSFYNLLDQYGFTSSVTQDNNSIWSSPLYFSLSSEVATARSLELDGIGSYGDYWAPHLYELGTASGISYNLAIVQDDNGQSGIVYPGDLDSVDGGALEIGKSVRCIARPVSNTIEGL